MDNHDPHLSRAVGARIGTRKRKYPPKEATLSERLRAGYQLLTVSWRNPWSEPPDGADRNAWGFVMPLGEDYRPVVAEHAPEVKPGSGWCHGWTSGGPPPVRWSEEAKGRVRRRNLRKRLDQKVPLFADLFEADELARRPDYFAGKPVEFTPPAHAAGIGHNSGQGARPMPAPVEREY